MGELESRKVGPRSHVWSEKEFVEQAEYEFAEVREGGGKGGREGWKGRVEGRVEGRRMGGKSGRKSGFFFFSPDI